MSNPLYEDIVAGLVPRPHPGHPRLPLLDEDPDVPGPRRIGWNDGPPELRAIGKEMTKCLNSFGRHICALIAAEMAITRLPPGFDETMPRRAMTAAWACLCGQITLPGLYCNPDVTRLQNEWDATVPDGMDTNMRLGAIAGTCRLVITPEPPLDAMVPPLLYGPRGSGGTLWEIDANNSLTEWWSRCRRALPMSYAGDAVPASPGMDVAELNRVIHDRRYRCYDDSMVQTALLAWTDLQEDTEGLEETLRSLWNGKCGLSAQWEQWAKDWVVSAVRAEAPFASLVPSLIESLDSPLHNDRTNAASILGRCAEQRVVDALIDNVTSHQDKASVKALVRIARLEPTLRVALLVRLETIAEVLRTNRAAARAATQIRSLSPL